MCNYNDAKENVLSIMFHILMICFEIHSPTLFNRHIIVYVVSS